jgi:hypothetical protein
MRLDWLNLTAAVLIASPFYCYLVASLVCNAYFKAKLRYHHILFSAIGSKLQSRE